MTARPSASDPSVSRRMSRQARRDTKPELEIRRLLHAAGLRYRVDHPPIKGIRRRADIVFTRQKIAVFVDGCFWHSCPDHATRPAANAAWWEDKLQGNRERDRDTDRLLEEAGWRVIRIWEHEPPAEAAARIEAQLAASGCRLQQTSGQKPGNSSASISRASD